MITLSAALFIAWIALFGQTSEIQVRLETKLWYLRALDWIETTTGLPPFVAISLLLALILSLVGLLVWHSRRRP